jgi:methionine biosynthesis protein MetW
MQVSPGAPFQKTSLIVDFYEITLDEPGYLTAEYFYSDPGVKDMPTIHEKTQHFIEGWIAPQSRVLDLGCGDGTLLNRLTQRKQVDGIGVEISRDMIVKCLGKGISVYQADIDHGLSQWDELSFDYVILTATLQVIHRPYNVINEMLRVGRCAIISVSNFGYLANRLGIMLKGRMADEMRLTGGWHDTPVIRFVSLKEFIISLTEMGIDVLDARYFLPFNLAMGTKMPLDNLIVKEAVFMLGHKR